jgi:hypothetical protein
MRRTGFSIFCVFATAAVAHAGAAGQLDCAECGTLTVQTALAEATASLRPLGPDFVDTMALRWDRTTLAEGLEMVSDTLVPPVRRLVSGLLGPAADSDCDGCKAPADAQRSASVPAGLGGRSWFLGALVVAGILSIVGLGLIVRSIHRTENEEFNDYIDRRWRV